MEYCYQGLKAWETLKNKALEIDLILTEVELPSVSGFSLLTLIMEHDICKNIPVIMMSSQDSVSMVFKCMLKGAAYFLIKPIRRNELRNLWQHVWRRNAISRSPQNLTLPQNKLEVSAENNAANSNSTGSVASKQKNNECSQKTSDAQSTCTSPFSEAESAYMESVQDTSQLKSSSKSSNIDPDTTKHEESNKFERESAKPNDEAGGFDCSQFFGEDDAAKGGEEIIPNILPNIRPPPSAFLAPKCALWDCFRPAQGLTCCQDYCSSGHELLANNEGLPGMTPRPGGIDVKDGPLFAAVRAKTKGKEVGIPKCEGAASTKSPWNAPELFDLHFLEGETLREWLFFDKPRRAFESGNRKQRSLPDYNGRGWHESRKQVMKEHGGQKRSYYMDPQPLSYLEWHLYEYEINSHVGCALYRLELKLVESDQGISY